MPSSTLRLSTVAAACAAAFAAPAGAQLLEHKDPFTVITITLFPETAGEVGVPAPDVLPLDEGPESPEPQLPHTTTIIKIRKKCSSLLNGIDAHPRRN